MVMVKLSSDIIKPFHDDKPPDDCLGYNSSQKEARASPLQRSAQIKRRTPSCTFCDEDRGGDEGVVKKKAFLTRFPRTAGTSKKLRQTAVFLSVFLSLQSHNWLVINSRLNLVELKD